MSSAAPSGAIPLVIDDRERAGPAPHAFAATNAFAIEFRRLPIGDYLLDNALLFERKTLKDLVASIQEGRLFSQALRLAEAKCPGALILEGTSVDLADSHMRREAIMGALVTVSLLIGLPVLRARTPTETAQTLVFAARQRVAVIRGALPRRGRRPKGKSALQRHILQGLPGIGPHRATRLLENFGSVAAAINADASALAAIDGIGKRTAGKIRWSVEEPPAVYQCTEGRTNVCPRGKVAAASAVAGHPSPNGIQT